MTQIRQYFMSVLPFKRSGLISDAFGTMVLRLFGIGLVFATTVVSAKVLGPAEFGAFNAGLSMTIVLASMLPMGTDRILARNVAGAKTPADAGLDTALAHLSSLIAATLLIGLGILLYCFASIAIIPRSWQHSAFLAAIMVVPVTLTNLRQWVAIPLMGTRFAVLPEQTLVPIAVLSAFGIAFALGIRMQAMSAAWVYAGIGTTVWMASLLTPTIRQAYSAALSSSPRPRQIVNYIRSALPFVNLSVGCILLQRCLPLITVLTCGFSETGQFVIAQQLSGLAAIPLGVATLVILPRCVRLFRAGQTEATSESIRNAATLTFALSVFIAFATWLATPLLPYLFGGSYARVEQILPILLLMAIVESVSGPSMAVMQAMNLEHKLSRSITGFVPLQLGLVYGFSRLLGLEGAAIGLLVARILWITMVVGIIFRAQRIVSLPSLKIHGSEIRRILLSVRAA